MKHFSLVSIAALLVICSCKKVSDEPTTNFIDGIGFPHSVGSYWKYQRIDSFYYSGQYTPTNLPNPADTSEEIITIVGNTIVPSISLIDSVLLLQIWNLKTCKADTNYLVYSKDKFSLYGHVATLGTRGYFYSPYGNTIYGPWKSSTWDKFLSFPLPATNSSFDLKTLETTGNTQYFLDTVFIKKDTSVVLPANTYNNSVFVNYLKYRYDPMNGSMGDGNDTTYNCYLFIKPAIGIVLLTQTPRMYVKLGSHPLIYYNYTFKTQFTRRLIDYKIK